MAQFDDVVLSWKGVNYPVPANKVLRLLAIIETGLVGNGVGINAVQLLTQPGGPPLTKLAMAYGGALRYAGADVTDEDCYISLAADITKGGAEGRTALTLACYTLLAMLFPDLSNAPGKTTGRAAPTGKTVKSAGRTKQGA